MKRLSGLVSASVLLYLSGIVGIHCAIAGAMPDESERAAEQVGSSASPSANQAIEMLLDNAADYVEKKNFDKAAAALERALRIEPQNADIWHLLAQVRLHQGQYQQAEAMAAKSNAYATQQPSLQQRNQHVIAVARQMAAGESVSVDVIAKAPAVPEQTIVIEKYSLQPEPEVLEQKTDHLATSSRLSEQTIHMIAQPRFDFDEYDISSTPVCDEPYKSDEPYHLSSPVDDYIPTRHLLSPGASPMLSLQ